MPFLLLSKIILYSISSILFLYISIFSFDALIRINLLKIFISFFLSKLFTFVKLTNLGSLNSFFISRQFNIFNFLYIVLSSSLNKSGIKSYAFFNINLYFLSDLLSSLYSSNIFNKLSSFIFFNIFVSFKSILE